MKRFIILLAFFSFFCQMRADKGTQVITDYKIENPNNPHGDEPRGIVTLPEVYQNDHVFTADSSCYGLTLRLVSNGTVAYETIVSSQYCGIVILPDNIVGTYELQIVDGIYIYYGTVHLE